ncbi:TonB-dependent receptor [Pedobacter frigiditerrae]|uniref:SusC/RagA family TonB-linked outer membrane protein n=1 Tax=Pedobacter frigiditerrae TaxID=2530452 RepID=UPI002931B01D|nr:TonB-dependent receptor [Pedobacter frigiditerrae]
MKQKLLKLFVLSLLTISTAFAQSKKITGKVLGAEDGLPIPGVSVKIKGTNTAVQTENNGTYSITVPSSETVLVYSYLSYVTIEKSVGNQTTINVSLESDSKVLNEVLVVGYGTTTKGAFTGSASNVKAADLQNRTVTNLNNALAGAAPGIQVNAGTGQPGAGPSIRVRGFGSISASNDPLYVVDGVQYSGNISNINVDDIENISLLKDAASSALYGSSAANGVIIITTKKGKSGGDKLSVKAMQGFTSRGIPEYETVSAYEYYPLAWQAYRNSLVYPATGVAVPLATANTTATNGIKSLLGNNPFNVADNAIVGTDGMLNPAAVLKYNDLDWADEITRVGKRGDYGLNYSGGTQKSDYYVSLGYVNEKGYVIRSDFQRFSGRMNVNSKPLSWFKTGLNISANITKSKQADADGSGSIVNPFNFSRYIGPIYPVYAHNPTTGALITDANGGKIYDTGNLLSSFGIPNRPSGAYAGRHILQETLLNNTLIKRNVIGARTYGEITFLKDFKFTTNVGVDISNYFFNDYQNKIVGDGAPSGRARNTSTTTTSYTIEQLLNYNKTIDKHNFSVLLGHNNYDYGYKYLTGARNTQILDGNDELINFATTTDLSSYTDDYRKEAVFARLNYDYAGKYFLSGSFRRDGSSKWAPGKQWGNFYSAGAAWIASSEDFLKNISWLNYLKLRGSYGELGNDGISGLYKYQAFYNLDNNNAGEPGIYLSSLATPDLTWEKNTQADIAVEFAMFKNRLHGSVEVFDRRSKDLLFNVPLPLSIGITSISKNIGTMWNKGVEIQLGGDILKSDNFKWDANINWSLTRNKITKMPAETPTIISGTKQLAVGHSIYDYWLRQWAGVDPTDGAALYEINPASPGLAADTRTINGKSLTVNPNNALFAYTGSAIPKFYGSITNTFTYKKISLSVLLNYQVGGKFYDATYQSLMSYSAYGGALHVDALNSWKAVGDAASIPRLDVGRSTFYNATSSRFLIDASYLNMRSATLSYELPTSLTNAVKLSNARVYVSGENLFTLSKRKGLDPSESFTGVNSNSYTPSRFVSLGLNVTF